ncbi:2Fe-2S iron-sulfur cluster-binding protein [Saccharomonospora azurea]|uniref:2Fe-2S iron-sulfur cluster-binding protein n=1 Tax=Saccharomonospora azurea TaxID=40988 RepID=UPI000301C230
MCQEGACGTCETRILARRADDHRDSILTLAEQAANRTMMVPRGRGLRAAAP